MKLHPWLGRFLKFALTAVVIYFVYRQVAGNWDAIRTHDWQFRWLPLALALMVDLIVFAFLSWLWRIVIHGFGHPISFPEAYRIFYLSNLGRYVPGRVWQLFGILYLAGRKGIPAPQATASFIAIQLFAIPASFVLFAVTAAIDPALLAEVTRGVNPAAIYLFVGLMILLSLAVMFFPQPVFALGDRILRRLKWGSLPFRMTRRTAIGLYFGYVLAWFAYGFAFWLFLKGVTGDTNLPVLAAIGAYNGAYQIGYLALFAPGGLGPREFVLTVMLSPFIGPIAAAIAVISRLWSILVEGIAALIALAVGK